MYYAPGTGLLQGMWVAVTTPGVWNLLAAYERRFALVRVEGASRLERRPPRRQHRPRGRDLCRRRRPARPREGTTLEELYQRPSIPLDGFFTQTDALSVSPVGKGQEQAVVRNVRWITASFLHEATHRFGRHRQAAGAIVLERLLENPFPMLSIHGFSPTGVYSIIRIT